MDFRWRDIDFEVSRPAQAQRCLMDPRPCVGVFVILSLPRLGVFLSLSIVRIDDRQRPP